MILRSVSIRNALFAAGFSLALTGCGNGPRLGETGEPMMVTQLAELPPPDGADPHSSAMAYRIGPLDKLNIVVAGVPELSDEFRTDTQGRFQLPYAGPIEASGLTTEQVAAIIRERLGAGFVNDPQVAVNLDESTNLVFTVGGQVNEAGSFPIDGHMTLMRALAAAKGLSEFARLDDVVIFRTVSGERMAALYNLGDIRRGVYVDPRVYAGDIVEVGDFGIAPADAAAHSGAAAPDHAHHRRAPEEMMMNARWAETRD